MKTFGTTNVGELIAALQNEDPESLVTFASDYGDHCHTQQVHSIKGEIEEHAIHETAYSESGWAVTKSRPGEDEPETKDAPRVLVIR